MYNLKIIKCGESLEIYRSNEYTVNELKKEEEFYRFIEPPTKREPIKGKQIDFNNVEEEEEKLQAKKEKYRLDNLKKTKEKIIRLIECNKDLDTFITLTYSNENMKDFKRSKKDISKLFNKISRDYKKQGKVFKYMWVLEYSKTNRLHFHVLTNYKVDIKLSKSNECKSNEHKQLEKEFNNRYWNLGIVDIRSLEQEGNTNTALYMAKYITKAMGRDLKGYRIYGYSQRLEKPIISKWETSVDIEDILKYYSDNYELLYSSSYPIGYVNKCNEEVKGIMSYFKLKEC